MTTNAINAMRLQEERRHNKATEEEAQKSRKFDLLSNILGATLRGLGTGVLGTITSKLGRSKTLSQVVAQSKSKYKGGNK